MTIVYANMHIALAATEKPLTDVVKVLKEARSEMLRLKQFPISGALWTAIDEIDRANVSIGEAMAMLHEKSEG